VPRNTTASPAALPPSDDAVHIIDRETGYQGFFRLDRYRFRHRLHAGGWSPEVLREVAERGRAVGLLLYDPIGDAVVLVEQFRIAAHVAGYSGWQLEVVAGIVDHDGESDRDVARREAQEEAGLVVDGDLLPIHHFMTSPGGTTQTMALFCGRVDASRAGGVHGLAEELEDIKVVVKPVAEAMRMLRTGKIENATTLVALYWLAAHRPRLRRLWR
jgi:ADP-ribose pyrophosphatase